MKNPICFALDGMLSYQADSWIELLEDHVGAFKVGLELFIRRNGLGLPKTKRDIVLDLKLHDIPETVENAVKAGGDLGAKYMTLHIQQHETIQRAVKAAEPYGMQLLGVTVLTSMAPLDCEQLHLGSPPAGPVQLEDWACDIKERVRYLAIHGRRYGLTGFVCSPKEVAMLRGEVPDGFFLVPGIRPTGSVLGDQKRVGTPDQAVKDGADLLVIGRPIRDAKEPITVIQSILEEVARVQVPANPTHQG